MKCLAMVSIFKTRGGHCGLRGYEIVRVKPSLFEHKSQNLLTKTAIFSMLQKKFSRVLINGSIYKRAALACRFQ